MTREACPELYHGVAEGEPQHPKMIPEWSRPVAPEGFPHLVAFCAHVKTSSGSRRQWVLDFFNPAMGSFASETQAVEVPWPWQPGFLPQASDWDGIGIPHMM